MIVRPVGTLIINSSLPALHLHAGRWLISMLSHFSHSCKKQLSLPMASGWSLFSIGLYFPERCSFLPARPTQSGASRQIGFSRPAVLFLPAMFFSCHFLLHIFHVFQHETVQRPLWNRVESGIRTVSIISRTVRLQVKKLGRSGYRAFQHNCLV